MPEKIRLIDPYGRLIHKLRVQITDACNFRCFYCIPQRAQFTPSQDLLSVLELMEICSGLVEFGIDEMRISGGEPTLRKDFSEIVKGLSELPVERLGVTTNGFFLKDNLSMLRKTKCRHINISLDSLNHNNFGLITKTDYFQEVLDNVLLSKRMGFHVKVNMVVLRGINDHEIFDFIEFSARHNIEVRFLELMRIGPYYKNHAQLFVSAQELNEPPRSKLTGYPQQTAKRKRSKLRGIIPKEIKKIEERDVLEPQSVNCDSTSFNFCTSSGAMIGFIASESQSFCGFCSRLRLTATGKLRACIMSEDGVNLRGVPKEKYPEVLKTVLRMKPLERLEHIEQPMYQIGG